MLLPRQVDFICMHLLEVLELWVSHGTNWASLSGPLDSVPGKIRNQGAPHWTSSHYIYVCLHGYHSQLSSSWHCPWITPRGPTAPNSLFHIQLSLKFANFLKHELSLTLHTQKQELLWAARRQSAILLISIGLLWLGKQTRFLERRKKLTIPLSYSTGNHEKTVLALGDDGRTPRHHHSHGSMDEGVHELLRVKDPPYQGQSGAGDGGHNCRESTAPWLCNYATRSWTWTSLSLQTPKQWKSSTESSHANNSSF